MNKKSAVVSRRRIRPGLAAFVVVAGAAFGFTGCSDNGETENTGGTGGVGGASGSTSSGGTSGTAGSSAATGGVGTGGSATGGTAGSGAGGMGTGGVAGSTGGSGAGGMATGGAAGSGTAGGGAGGTAGMGGSLGGAGASAGGMAGGAAGAGMGGAGASAGGAGAGMSGAAGSAGGGAEDLDMQPEDFECIQDWQKVLGFRINNLLGHLDEALEVANSDTGGVYPVGTILQHFPTEAMVKRRAGFSPETKDWEFFLLQISASGTTIVERGTTDIMTMGNTCASCHSEAPDQWDFVCNTWGDQGTANCGFNLSDSQLNTPIMNDPRCD